MMDFWRWGNGEIKMHVEKDFARHLIKNQKIKYSAIYRDRRGKLLGYDFLIQKTDRERFERLNRKFLSENNGDNSSDSKGEITHSDFKSDVVV